MAYGSDPGFIHTSKRTAQQGGKPGCYFFFGEHTKAIFIMVAVIAVVIGGLMLLLFLLT